MLRLKDVLIGDCWRFVDVDGPPDLKPTFTTAPDAPRPKDAPKDTWDQYETEFDDDEEEWSSYFRKHRNRPVELLEHYSTHPVPVPLRLTRGDLRQGECFQYLDDGEDADEKGTFYVVDGRDVSYAGMPGTWCVSTANSGKYRLKSPVRRVPHWLTPNEAPGPRVLPCVDPLEKLLARKANGVDGRECLARLEVAMRTESVVRRKDSDGAVVGHISTNGEFGGLDEKQFELGRLCWEAKLHHLTLEAREKERVRVVLDHVDAED